MKKIGIAATLVASILIWSGSASAATINLGSSQLNGNTVNDFSLEGLVDFDFIIDNDGLTFLVIDLSASEMAAGSVDLRFAGLASFAGGIETISLSDPLGAFSFGVIGDAINSNGNDVAINLAANYARLNFVPSETGVFTVGALGSGVIDWQINFPTDTSSIRMRLSVKEGMVVPLPAGIWLFVSGLTALGFLRRRDA